MVNVRKLIGEQKDFYRSLKSIYCPILEENVFFTSEGFYHLIYESNHIPRNIAEQILKLSFLKYVPDAIAKCSITVETRRSKRKINGRHKKILYYQLLFEFEKGKKVRIILERIGEGKIKFKSVMPHNRKSKTKKRQRR